MMGKQARTQPIAARVTSLVARVAQHGTASEAFRVAGALEQLVPVALGAHGTETQGPAVRALAAMATKDPSTITALREDFGTFFETLGGVIPTLDDTVVGNASMLVSQCATHETNLPLMGFVVEPLVKVMHKAANDNRKAVAKNAANALARLAKYPVHLDRIRDLHGI